METIRQLEESYKDLQNQAHDFRNHLVYIQEMIRNPYGESDFDETAHYVEELAQDILSNQLYSGLHVKNTALRAIMRRVQKQCEELKIRFSPSIEYSDFSFMAFKDICSFFANAFDNAMDACKQASLIEKFISIEITNVNEIIHIRIANTNSMPVERNQAGFVSSKSNSYRIGIGTRNMKRSIERYNGMMDVHSTDDCFEVTAVLPISLQESTG